MKVNVQYLVWYVAGLVSICVFFLFSGNLKTYRTYHGDETYWIRSGQWTFQKMFVEKNYSSELWSKEYGRHFGSFGPRTPNAAKLIIGGALHLFGYTTIPLPITWDWNESFEENIKKGNAIPVAELIVARQAIVLVTAMTAGFLFIIGFHLPMSQRQYSWITALLITGVFLSHPYVARLGKQAMIDMPMILFSIIAIYAIWRGTNPTLTTLDALRWGIISGLSGGIAISTKLNAILLLISCLLVGLINVYYSRSKPSVLLLLPILFFPAPVFFLLNPQTWSDIGAGIQMMIEHSNIIVARRERFPEAALWTIGDKVGAFQDAVFGNPFNGILFLIGFYLLLRNWRQTYPFSVYGVITMAGVIVWTPLNWDRYYLPAVPFYAISVGYLVGKVLESTSILTAREDVSSLRKESSG